MLEVKPRTSMNAHRRCMRPHRAPGGASLARSSRSCRTDGGVEVADLADALGVSPATIRRDLELLEEQRLLARTHGGAVPHGRALRAAAALQGARGTTTRSAGSPQVAAARDRRRHGGRAHRRHHLHRGRARAGRPRAAHRRDERAQHRERAGRPPEPEAGRHRRHGAAGVLRAGRPAGRAVARRPEPRPGRASGSTASTREAGCTTHHEVEAHTEPRADRARATAWSSSPTPPRSATSRSRGSARSSAWTS